MRTATLPALAVALTLTACNSTAPEPGLTPLESPAPAGAVFPTLLVGDESLWMSWTEPATDESEPRVQLARMDLRHGDWDEVETIQTDARLFVNWADFPTIQLDAAGRIGANWLVRSGGPSWAYGIRFAVRQGPGDWSVPAIPHRQDHAAEHGFVSLVSEHENRFDVVWLDGREMPQDGAMELRHNVWDAGRFQHETILDADVCTCCQTDATADGENLFVAYRDHAAGEIRDISFVRFDGKVWSRPVPLSHDGWQIAACPVNGPAVGSHGRNLAVAWFTQAHDQPRVWARQSTDFGAQFGEPIAIDLGDPIGRIDLAVFDDGSFVVVWLESVNGEAVVALRRIDLEGKTGPVQRLGVTSSGRDSGFPRMATDGETLWVAWTETSRPTRLRLTRVRW